MLKYKIAVCAGVFLAGLATGWLLNSRLLPETGRNAGRPSSGDTLQSRALHTDHMQDFFKPREYIKINWSYQDDRPPSQP
ncbi:MAG: hypothetical protein K0Q90_1839 [Paenibacillaceae bacterium]|jgi:hypothetical protein|nr:hypothetical protein [Paenibacillaceae bacterium]